MNALESFICSIMINIFVGGHLKSSPVLFPDCFENGMNKVIGINVLKPLIVFYE